jgi:transcription elongation factor GreA
MSDEQYFLTPEGLEKIKKELHELQTIKRKEVAEKIEAAKALGDLSENAEYQEAKEESAWLESRILELSNLLAKATIVQDKNKKENVVTIGRRVVVKNKEGERVFIIVGANEADPVHGRISSGSPLGSALLGRQVGETVEVSTPGGIQHYEIIKIE